MKNRKQLVKKFLFPPVWLICLLVPVSAGLLVWIFMSGYEEAFFAYPAYILAFYTLSVLTLLCICVLPGKYRAVKEKVYQNPFGNRYMTDAVFRAHMSLYGSLAVNLLFVAFYTVSSILYHTAWFGILAAYYSILSVMRFLLLRYINRNAVGEKRVAELKRARICAVMLLLVNITLSGAVLMILYQNRGYTYNSILIYVMAGYTFYVTTHAIINLIRYRKSHSPVLLMAKVISVSAAAVSMLTLETAMLAQFGGETSPEFQKIMVATTGAGVSVIIVALAAYTIIRSTVEIRKSKKQSFGELPQ